MSGSGKSSLAFDTLFAEGQRRYIETFSPYARQFFDRMDKPQVDSIEGIPPAIAIEQRNAVRTTRSTVGTMTEICDYMKVLWPHLAQLHCRQCGQPVRKDSPQQIWQALVRGTNPTAEIRSRSPKSEVLITFDLPLSEKLSLEESLALVAKQGYQRLLLDGQIVRLEERRRRALRHPRTPTLHASDRDSGPPAPRRRPTARASSKPASRPITSAKASWPSTNSPPRRTHTRTQRATPRIVFATGCTAPPATSNTASPRPPCSASIIRSAPARPARALAASSALITTWRCPTARGRWRKARSSRGRRGMSAECQDDLLQHLPAVGVPTDVPFSQLPQKQQDLVIEGDPDYGKDEEHEWPRAWYGVKGYFRWLESKAYKMHVRVLLSRYRAYTPCPDCRGKRLQPEALLYRCGGGSLKSRVRSPKSAERGRAALDEAGSDGSLTLADFYPLPIRDALPFIGALAERHRLRRNDPLALVLDEVRARLGYLNEVGLGYLTLDRPTRTLSGGETERVNLTTCLGTRLVNTLFVLDEPSVGLHPRDTDRLVRMLEQLRDAGNTVVVVEHEASVMRAADQIVDLGPGHGATGGEVVFQGTYPQLLQVGQVADRPISAADGSGSRFPPRAEPRSKRRRSASQPAALPCHPPQPQGPHRRNPAGPVRVRHRRQRLRQDHAGPRRPAAGADSPAPIRDHRTDQSLRPPRSDG